MKCRYRHANRWLFATCLSLPIAALCTQAEAAPGTTFGVGPRDEALARSAVSEGDATDCATANPAFGATEGTRIRLGYGAAGMFLRINDRDAGVAPVTGLDLATQVGKKLSHKWWAGLGLSFHRPDLQLARISFRPATEPQFVLYEAAQQRTALNVIAALRYGPLSIGGGASFALGVGGPGVDIGVGQNANGPRADGALDINLGYKLAPLVGVTARMGRLQLGASFRGEVAVDLSLKTVVQVNLTGNPLNGTTTVIVEGASGYEPARVDLGARVLVARGLRAYAAVEYSAFSAAPPPVADVTMDVNLTTRPSQKDGHFVEPRFRDTLSPKLGVEWKVPALPPPATFFGDVPPAVDPWKFALRAGYAFNPSPVPPQTGFTSYADGGRHMVGVGAAYHFGDVLGVDLTLSFAAQFHELEGRTEKKKSAALPFAAYHSEGEIVRGSLAVEGFVR
ncbi:MAG: hypothetical protein IPK82_27345 [Polyangiaceae bacterium]|nr:hypothetical protein [Polyangiaceae bacterium]